MDLLAISGRVSIVPTTTFIESTVTRFDIQGVIGGRPNERPVRDRLCAPYWPITAGRPSRSRFAPRDRPPAEAARKSD